MEENTTNTTPVVQEQNLNKLLDVRARESTDVKEVIDLLATQTALSQKETVDKIVDEKSEELRKDAEKRRIQAETEKINKEIERIKAEKEKEVTELNKEIERKKAEAEQLKAESDKAQVFFESNEDILSCIGVKRKKTLRVMYWLMIPAVILFVLIRFIALPLTIIGKLAEIVINIIGDVCKAISNNALKIIISVLVVALLLAGGFAAYYFGGDFLTSLFNK